MRSAWIAPLLEVGRLWDLRACPRLIPGLRSLKSSKHLGPVVFTAGSAASLAVGERDILFTLATSIGTGDEGKVAIQVQKNSI